MLTLPVFSRLFLSACVFLFVASICAQHLAPATTKSDSTLLRLTMSDALERARKNTVVYQSALTDARVAREDKKQAENLQWLIQVTARLEAVDLGIGIARVQKAVNDMYLPSAVRVEYGGQYEEQQKSFHDLLMVLLLAVLIFFAVLPLEFRTFLEPIAILVSALLSTFGAFAALLVTRTTVNVASFMGMIMDIGIVAKNGILLLDAEHGFKLLGFSLEDSMIQAGRRGLRPIAMTALATIAGMFPLALAIGAGAQMLQRLAIAVIGGLPSSMVLSLVFTPAIHYFLQRRLGEVPEVALETLA